MLVLSKSVVGMMVDMMTSHVLTHRLTLGLVKTLTSNASLGRVADSGHVDFEIKACDACCGVWNPSCSDKCIMLKYCVGTHSTGVG